MGHHNSKPGGVQREAYVAITNMTRYVHDRSSSQVLTVAKHAQDIVHAQVQLDYTASKHGGKPFKPARTIKYKWKELKTSVSEGGGELKKGRLQAREGASELCLTKISPPFFSFFLDPRRHARRKRR